MKELREYREEVKFVEDVITNPNKTSVVAVMNPEMLPLYETERAHESLRKFGVSLNMVVVNKVITVEKDIPEIRVKLEAQRKVLEEIEKKFRGIEIIRVPMFPEEPRGGLDWLEKLGGA